jgi:putative radical SAM enzyme (TIGR03279 family)
VKEKNRAVVRKVTPGSIAEEAGIQTGDILLFINREKITDIIDYRFLVASEQLLIEVLKPSGDIWEIEVEKDEYEDLGIEFEDPMICETRQCTNKCIFCFIDQLPHGMRDTLYFKDDDMRLSFLTGNYVTLTNMGFEDMDRIVKYKMSPINVSVHTTNPELRKMMLNNRFAGDILEKIKVLVDGGITVNCQIVLCRGINDETELDNSISDLTSFFPALRSLSVVPVGITRYRKGLYNLKPYDKESSDRVINQVEKWQNKLLNKYGSRVVFLADEFYIMAGRRLPGYEHYEEYPQIENGVGLVTLLLHEFTNSLTEYKDKMPGDYYRKISIATGVSVKGYIDKMAEILKKRYNKLEVQVYQIKNSFFGDNVTVTGLLTGRDIISQLKDKELGEQLLISSSMLKAGEDMLLDGITVGMLEEQLDVKVIVVENNGRDFINKVLGIGVE